MTLQPDAGALVDRLAQEIRRVDGRHSLGAGALAEALLPFVEALAPPAELTSNKAGIVRPDNNAGDVKLTQPDGGPPCSTHPDAPHGFDRNGSHGADRYMCDCEGWEPGDHAAQLAAKDAEHERLTAKLALQFNELLHEQAKAEAAERSAEIRNAAVERLTESNRALCELGNTYVERIKEAERSAEALRGLLTRIRDDKSWRTNDNALWPDIVAAITTTGRKDAGCGKDACMGGLDCFCPERLP